MTEWSALRDEHRQIERLAHELSRMVMRPLPPNRAELERVRRNFTMSVGRHLRHEDEVVYPRLLEIEDAGLRAVARRLIAESAALTAKFNAFCDRWSGSAIVADWSGFRYAASELLGLIDRRMVAEEYELFPQLAAYHGAGPDRTSPWSATNVPGRLTLESATVRVRR